MAYLNLGMRQSESHCAATRRWALEVDSTSIQSFLKLGLLASCKLTTNATWFVMIGLPEILLYSLTFWHIHQHTKQTALSGRCYKCITDVI
jgi:hypothetical protein